MQNFEKQNNPKQSTCKILLTYCLLWKQSETKFMKSYLHTAQLSRSFKIREVFASIYLIASSLWAIAWNTLCFHPCATASVLLYLKVLHEEASCSVLLVAHLASCDTTTGCLPGLSSHGFPSMRIDFPSMGNPLSLKSTTNVFKIDLKSILMDSHRWKIDGDPWNLNPG